MKKEVLIIGGGIVGLATAWRLMEARPDLKVTVLEKEPELATHQTGHNSGVIHSGIYYRPGTLRARNCMEGYGELLRFCDEHAIPYDICGKIIVATRPEELPHLDKILDHGLQNGLKDIRRISAAETREHEPHVNVVESLWVPQAGIINYRKVANKYAELITARGGVIRTGFKVTSIKRSDNEITVIGEAGEVSGDLLISCAGLYADKVAKMTGQKIPGIQILPFRGEYYELKPEKQYLVNNLIYPVPNPEFPFLGVHYTRMIEGGIEAGPNAVLAFRREGYSRWDLDLPELLETLSYPGFMRLAAKHWRYGWGEMYRSFSKSAFVKALQHLIPEVGYDDLQRGGAGVRAMACDLEGKLIDEFLIFEDHNIINVCSAPSPAATASLAIGKTIAGKALERV
ncbi:L-2-hydroxyglutarate oxidase [Haliscomenobacter hydrossis]|uniref:FAD dependent oxidoreductase n=1 Tax=Haliscomenobacter hydrossis (strain ATCC 27775 / DSM 1100 / LMG 10767 / O) TaxID=760192 RepID=F4KVF3_HALH1|nr:L-2-hydroxyglutarate oxidase [Haliscomenobacter hydrossis]AEE51266.1 FAD dependent oxidoreductase [Haliscomenobacter hydrossis DSM 1100]